jgi:FkbM family methyltransferase
MYKAILQPFIRKVLAIANPIEFYAAYTHSRPPILHIGAHLGEEEGSYKRLGFTEVNWVEAQPKIFEILTTRVSPKNCLQAAVWSERTTLEINVSSNSVSSSVFEFGENTPWKELQTLARIEVQTITLHDVVSDFENRGLLATPFILLLDIQGAELQALAGLGKLRSRVCAISCEVSVTPTYEKSASRREIYKLMLRNKYLPAASFLDEKTGHGDQLFLRMESIFLKPKLFYFFVFRASLLGIIRGRSRPQKHGTG